jgi:hypothetical protein
LFIDEITTLSLSHLILSRIYSLFTNERLLEHEKLYFWHVISALVYEWPTNYDPLCFFDGVELMFLWDLDQKALNFLSVKKKDMDLIFNNHYLLKKTILITSTSQQNTYVCNIYNKFNEIKKLVLQFACVFLECINNQMHINIFLN